MRPNGMKLKLLCFQIPTIHFIEREANLDIKYMNWF
jgi:hypothetical protein